jgi:glycosyltransferase involved in cell wall biosynthesis
MKPLVSILIPAYNAAPLLPETVRSALAQTWPHTEIIIVDDGSTDDTLAVAQQFAGAKVTVVTQKNSGAATARNRAFELAKGDFIQWLDADDLLAPDKIERQMAVAEKTTDPKKLFSAEWGRFFFRTERARFDRSPLWADQDRADWLTNKMSHNAHMQPATWLVSRTLTQAAGPWDTRLSLDDDGEYFCRVLAASSGVTFVSGAKCFYRMTSFGSLSIVDQSDKKLESLWASMQAHVRTLRALEDSLRTRAAVVTYLGNWLNHFYPARPDLIAAAQQLAASLGGKLELPALRPKYAWLEKFCGRQFANRAQSVLPALRIRSVRTWDKFMFERHRP